MEYSPRWMQLCCTVVCTIGPFLSICVLGGGTGVLRVLRAWGVTRVLFAQHSLCESERARVQAARKHILVWAPRQSPPPDWHLPLPQEKDE